MSDPIPFAWAVLALPLAGTILISLLWRVLPGRSAGWIGTGMIFAAFACAVVVLVRLEDRPAEDRTIADSAWDYADTVGLDAKLTILVDPLSTWMMLVVTGVSALIHLYSVTYVWKDRGFARYFAYLNYFVFSMLLLVLAGNFIFLIVGWAFVGAASYLLISFWYRRTTATRAGIKAFVINIVGDVGLILGTFFVFKGTGSLDFLTTFSEVKDAFSTNDGELVAGCICLLVGAAAKSAQIPLHTWLPDAMEGPTPVSSLIHAATMVTAGVYLVARMHPLFERAPAAADVGVVVGGVTLFVAATVALVQTDIKRAIAYSTMSQIGYMFMGVSAGAYWAGIFHLTTHAFFKALLFMGAGSVIGAMGGEQSMDKMGGFRRAMPFTFLCFLAGGLALAAAPPFSGFWSKDEILLFLGERGSWFWIFYVVGYVGAFLTAIYTFRIIFRTFFGDKVPEAEELEQGHQHHAEHPFNPATGEEEDTDVGFPGPGHYIAERSWPMKIAMSVLAVGAVVAGILHIPDVTHIIDSFLEPTFADSPLYEPPEDDTLLVIGLALSTVLSLGGIALAYVLWVRRPELPGRLRERLAPVYTLLHHKWYFDEAIDLLFVRPAAWVGRFAAQTFERVVIEGGIVDGAVSIVKAGSSAARALQNGFLRYYVALLLLGLGAVALYFLIVSS